MFALLSQGFVPFFVSATAGTTVYGAFDPLIAISDICRKYGVWMHVDVSANDPPLNCLIREGLVAEGLLGTPRSALSLTDLLGVSRL